jgi:hypothetical protein
VGDRGAPREPNDWLNVKGIVSWRALQGRLVLIEKWATW